MRSLCVVLDVEGVLFKTSISTLTSVKSSTLNTLIAGGDWKKQLDQQGHLFIDRDSRLFPIILSYLRDGPSIPLPSEEWMLAKIAHEARYFNLPQLENMANAKRKNLLDEVKEIQDPLRNTHQQVQIPLKKSQFNTKESKGSKILSHFSISLPRNFSHLSHIGWRGTDMVLSTRDPHSAKDPSLKAIQKAAKEANQVYNLVDGDHSKYGSQGVQVVLSSTQIRPLPPFRPLPPVD